MVTGGALVKESGQYRWKAAGQTWLFPAKEFSAAFRKAFCEGVRRLWQQGKLRLGGERALGVEQMLKSGQSQRWEVYIQTPRGQPEDLLDYLGRYVYRTAMSNHRILAVSEKKVRFEYYDNRGDGQLKEMQLDGVEFMRRYLQHILPKGFQRVRHYALHHDRVAFEVDNVQVFESPVSPHPPLGLVIWIDNQYAAFTPDGKIGFGVLANPEPAWLEINELEID